MKNKKDDIELVHQYGIYPSKRLLILMGDVDEDTVRQTCANILALDSHSTDPITLILNTPGGDWWNGLAIYDTIKACGSPVTIIGTGHVMSMGTVILQAADERILAPHCRLMIHYGFDGTEGDSREVLAYAKEVEHTNKTMEHIYLGRIRQKHPKYTVKALKELMTVDKYLSAKECVALGLADKVME